MAYEAVSYLDYRTDVDLSERAKAFYTRVPAESNRRTQELARQMRTEAGSDAAFIENVMLRFHEKEYYYTLEPPPLGANPVDRFMFDTMQGFCEHYASAFAVMMRAAGIPSRVVLGYQGGEVNPMGGHMIVRQSDAHAWNEVWLEGVGWRRVDPTSAVAPERIEMGRSGSLLDGVAAQWGFSGSSMWIYQLEMYYDAINAKWNEWVLGYGPENQKKFMEFMFMEDPDWRKMMLTMIAIVIGMVLLISFFLALRYRPPKRDKAAILYKKFVKRSGVNPAIGETPATFALRLHNESRIPPKSVDAITSIYLEARYGPENPANLEKLQASIAALP
jgi:hypothetical protein